MRFERNATGRGWIAAAVVLLAAGCGREPQPVSVGDGSPVKAAPMTVSAGTPCEPTPLAARGRAVAGYHCDDVTAPDRPVWRAGLPTMEWFDVTLSGGDRRARADDGECDEDGFQAAVDAACRAGGGVVFAPPGRYRLCRKRNGDARAEWSVEIPCSDVHLRGASVEGTFIVGDPAVRATNKRTMFRFIDGDRVSMARCTIDGSYDGERAGWGNGIRGLGVRDSTFVDMKITDHYNHNIALKPSSRSSDDNLIARLITERGRQTNIIVYSAAKAHGIVKNRRNKIVDCSATGAQVHFGLEVRYSDDTEILGGLYAENKNGGINIEESAFRTRIVGAVLRGNRGAGLAIWGKPTRVRDTVCEDCVIESNGELGVRNLLGDGTVLRRTKLVRNGRHGYADSPSPGQSPPRGTVFEDCEIVGNGEWGVLARGPGHVMTGGIVRDNGSGQGRAGIRTLEEAADMRVAGTRFADGVP